MLQKIDPKKVVKTVSAMDGAIDKENSNMENFEKTHDLKYVKFLKDEKPTYFLIKNVATTIQAQLQEDHYEVVLPNPEDKDGKPTIKQKNQTEMLIKYFREGCEEYEEDKKKFTCDPDVFPFSIVQEIGSFIMLRTALGDDEKKLLES